MKLLAYIALAFFAIELIYVGITYLDYVATRPMTEVEAMQQLSGDM